MALIWTLEMDMRTYGFLLSHETKIDDVHESKTIQN